MENRKAMFLGIDGAIPKMIRKFAAEGDMPNLKKLMDRGCYSEMLSQIPVATPINWASLSTGAVPGVHNVVGFWCHKKGERIDRFTSENAFTNTFVGAERIWQAVERQGGRSVLLKFPGSWPPSVERGEQVDGYCIPGYDASVLDLAANGCFAVQKLHKARRIELSDAGDWKNAEDYPAKAQAEISIPLRHGHPPLLYHLLACGGQGYERVLLCRERDAATAVFNLTPGRWGDWAVEALPGGETATVRFKLISLSPDGTDLRLYHSQIYPGSGYTRPDALAAELREACGPWIEFASAHAWKYGWTDLETCYEEARYQVEWMGRAAKRLLSRPWNLFVTQMHWVDHIQHYFLAYVDPASPNYTAEKAPGAWEVLRRAYRLADDFIGRLAELADGDTAVFVLSDHGNLCDEYTVSLLPLFVREGLIATRKDKDGNSAVDWSRTLAYPCKPGNCDVYINLKGRDEEGCVEPEDYEAVRDRVIELMRGLRAPNGKRVFAQVLRCEDAVPLGLYGEYVSDIVAVYADGMSWAGHGGEEWDREDAVFAPSLDTGWDYCAHHGPMSPTAETEICSNKAFLVAAGRGIRAGYDRTRSKMGPVRVLDVAPTICKLLDCEPPAQNQGAVIGDFLA